MRSIKFYNLFLLLLILSPFIFPAIDIQNRKENYSSDILINEISDKNNDKIDDNLANDLEYKEDETIEVIVEFNRAINSVDRFKLLKIGANFIEGSWDLNRRVKIKTKPNLLDKIAEIHSVVKITASEKRLIMIAIEGLDFNDLAKLKQYKDTKIFWNVGCALISSYSGIENDINLLGTYDAIMDTTDLYLHSAIIENPSSEITANTVTNANTINASSLWSIGINGTGVKVGNIDTGINNLHYDLAGRIFSTQSFISTIYGYDENITSTNDPDGHGSHTSGIMIGNGTANSSYKGIAFNSEIIFAKVGTKATLSSVVAAIDWLISEGAETINLSYGGTDSPGLDIVEIAFRNAVRNHDVLCSLSAGNEGADGFYTAGTPGTTDDVITVGNVNDWEAPPTISYSSSRGPTADDHMKPDVMAPGTNIYSCHPTSTNTYISRSGTSMAAPQVTGAIALLIGACKDSGIEYNPGLIKGALMKTADIIAPISSNNLLKQGRGIVNVGAAWDEIIKATKEGAMPIIGACNPIQEPLHYWVDLVQGQVAEQYLTCVSPFKTDLSLEISGSASAFVTIGTIPNEYSAITKLTFNIPIDATIGDYSGILTFKYKTYELDTITIDFSISESNGHRMLLNYRTTNYGIDHMYRQFNEFTKDILNNGYVISEQNVTLDSTILSEYEAIWLPDPFNYHYPLEEDGNYTIIETNPSWAIGELMALTNYVNNGGSVFICLLGQIEDTENHIILNTNVSAVNEFTEQFGIHVRDTNNSIIFPITVDTVALHPLTVGVEAIDHWGCSLELSGDAVQLTELSSGSNYATLAASQTPNGGRVVVLTTNFALDEDGYRNYYNYGYTQNNQFGRNLFRWITAKHRMQQLDNTVENGVATITYEYLNGPGADFGGYVITPSEQINLIWEEIDENIWQANYSFTETGLHFFFPECGLTKVDDFDYFIINADEIATSPSPSETPTNTTTPTTTASSGYILLSIMTIFLSSIIVTVVIRKYRK